MTDGVRAELAVDGPTNCPVATVSTELDESVGDVRWARDADGRVVEEFRVDAEAAAVDAGADAPTVDAAETGPDPLVDVGDQRVYRFTDTAERDCVCEVVESLGTPLVDVRAEGETLVLTLHLDGVDRLREIVTELDAVAERVRVRYLVHATADADADTGGDVVVVERDRVTDRQLEVLRTAYEMGYFAYPRDSNATEVAEALDIGLSTFTEHLTAAQSRLFEAIVTG